MPHCPDCDVPMTEYDGGDHIATDGWKCPECDTYWTNEELNDLLFWRAQQDSIDQESRPDDPTEYIPF